LEVFEEPLINYWLQHLINKTIALISIIKKLSVEKLILFKPYGIYEKLSCIIHPNLTEMFNVNVNFDEYLNVLDLRIPVVGLPLHLTNIPTILYYILGNFYVVSRYLKYIGYKNIFCEDMSKKRIILFSVNKKQADTIVAIVKKLKEDADLMPIVVDWDSNAQSLLKENSIPYQEFYSFLDITILNQTIKLARHIIKKWDFVKNNCEDLWKLYFKGYNISKIVITVLDYIFSYKLYGMLIYFLLTRKIIKKLDVSCVLVTNEREPIAKSCVFGAKSCGAKTYNCQRGILVDHPEIGTLSTDKMFVDGEYYKDILIKRGVDPKKIVVTGNPRFDLYYEKISSTNISEVNNKTRKRLKIGSNERIILVIEQPLYLAVTQLDKILMIRGSLKAAKAAGARTIIKLHPNQHTDYIERKVVAEMNMPETLIIKDEIALFDLLVTADVIIIRSSTVGLDAVLLSKPLIDVKFIETGGKNMNISPYAGSGVALEARTEDDIIKYVMEILHGNNYFNSAKYCEARNKFIKYHLYSFDGLCAQRVIESIKEDLIQEDLLT
jgi:hypothetical protein